MTDNTDSTTSERLAEIHDTVQQKSREGLAMEWGYDATPGYVYYDEETDSWLCAFHVEGGYNKFPSDTFPKGHELGVAWDDAEWVPVEETPLHHGVYGLDHAREGYGPVVSDPS
jgi:hypothetical protein